jgi:hypothetical protein
VGFDAMKAEEVCLEALEKSSRSELAAYLDQVCGDDAGLRHWKKNSLARQRGAALSSLSREGARLGLMSAGVIAPLPRSRSRFRPGPAQGAEGIKMEWDWIVARK